MKPSELHYVYLEKGLKGGITMHDTYRRLTKVLWGFLFVLIDINSGYVDIVPDFIGYAMVAYGLMQLDFEKERNLAAGIAIISFPSFFIPNRNLLAPVDEGYYWRTYILLPL